MSIKSLKSPFSNQFGDQYGGGLLFGDPLWKKANSKPTLDLKFADSKNLLDYVSTNNLISFTRASTATFVGSNGLIQTAGSGVARFTHDPVTGESLGLLIEGARTNLALRSEDFANAAWSKGNVTVTANSTAAPDGTVTADLMLETTSTDNHFLNYATAITYTTATQSFYVKPNGRTNVALRTIIGANDWYVVVFNLTGNGSVTQTSAGSSTAFSAISGTIANAGNGWYRISATATQPNRPVFTGVVDLCTTSTPTLRALDGVELYSGDTAKGVYLWGGQVETGSIPTSYIPTAASTVTRAADVATLTGASFSSWYNQTEGTLFVDGSTPAFVQTVGFVSINAASTTNRLEIRQSRTNPTVTGITTSITWTQVVAAPTFVANTSYRQAVAVSNASHGNSINASLDTSSTVIGTIAATQLVLGMSDTQSTPTGGSSSTIKRLTYWPTRLANTTLQSITES